MKDSPGEGRNRENEPDQLGPQLVNTCDGFSGPKSGPKCYKPKLAKVGWAKEGFGQSRLWPFFVFTIGTLIVEIILIMFFNILENPK